MLNSLAGGEYVSKTLSVLKPGGRFIEIGKRDLLSPEEVAKEGYIYHAFDLAEICQKQPQQLEEQLQKLLEEFAKNTLKPLPYKVFPITHTVSAFRYMQQAKHQGKIIISHPTSGKIRSEASYLVAGGLGGLGLQITRHLIALGAKNIILLGRSYDEERQKTLDALQKLGIKAAFFQVDIAKREQLENTLTKIRADFPPICGVIHSAGILRDGIIVQQDWQNFAQVMAPKIQGSWNLHQLLTEELDFFVMFSSIASVLGSPGQSNYAAANAFVDALSHLRHAQGLPALSINWGPWAEYGMAANMEKSQWQSRGIDMIQVDRGLSAFMELLPQMYPQMIVLPVDWNKFGRQFAQVPPLLSEIVKKSTSSKKSHIEKIAMTLKEAPPAKRHKLMVSFLQRQVAAMLGLNSAKSVLPAQGFFDMGIDSLTAIELKNSIESAIDDTIPQTAIFDYPNINTLADFILTKLNLKQIETTEETIPEDETEERKQQLNELSENDLVNLLAKKLGNIQKKE